MSRTTNHPTNRRFPIDPQTCTIREMRQFLKDRGFTHSFARRKDYVERIEMYRAYWDFPWREDQFKAIQAFFLNDKTFNVVQGLYGSGKTSMLIGIVLYSVLLQYTYPGDIMFLSFNVCIRNEISSKLKSYGFKNKIKVRTFDSLVYEICKNNHYPYIDVPNYAGKRQFVYDLIRSHTTNTVQLNVSRPSLLFIDEIQDLEYHSLEVFRTFFPETKFLFVGDIFQSIQREPKESLLWHLLHNHDDKDIYRTYMYITPRVPKRVLTQIKDALTEYYPAMRNEISKWRSSNSHSHYAIEFKNFDTYSEIYKAVQDFVNVHGPSNTMVLTFSSAITVRGALGDLARLRNRLLMEEFDLNANYKKMEDDKLFLSTVNSSKGLERDNVIIVSTFPLEKAFFSFSYDITMNLISVGLTRAKRKVVVYVPNVIDHFSHAFTFYDKCPLPTRKSTRPVLNEYKWYDYLNTEHSVTECINLKIILYDTRIDIRRTLKFFEKVNIFKKIPETPIIKHEEDSAFIGTLIELLITSTWTDEWPGTSAFNEMISRPKYLHICKYIHQAICQYKNFIKKHKHIHFNTENSFRIHFEGIVKYCKIHMAVYNCILIKPKCKDTIRTYWKNLKPYVIGIKPYVGPKDTIKIQHNAKSTLLNGILDVFISRKEGFCEIWEIKASVKKDWKDDATLQACMYALMCAKKKCRIYILNVFTNEKIGYFYNAENINTLRDYLFRDILIYNFNAYLVKCRRTKKASVQTKNKLFLYRNEIQHITFAFFSPYKLMVKEYYFVHKNFEDTKKVIRKGKEKTVNVQLNKCNKLQRESEITAFHTIIPNQNQYEYWELTHQFPKLKKILDLMDQTDKDNIHTFQKSYTTNQETHTPNLGVESRYNDRVDLNFSEGIVDALSVFAYVLEKYKFS